MPCGVSEEQLWSWIDDDAPELRAHLAECPRCRKLAQEMRSGIRNVGVGSTPLSVPLPEKVGSYVIKELLGEGGQGLVYEAEQQTPHRAVALKVLKGGRVVKEQDLRHFERESQALAALNHPGIATVYEAGRTEEGQHFFAMELVGGVPLDVYVRENKLPPEQRLELLCKVCDAVHYAHQQGVIHRDLKSTNILIDAEGHPKILDFGLARLTDIDVTLTAMATKTGQIMGTLRYMSPEQARGEPDEIGVASDVYALGVILYELLTDQPPYNVSKSMLEAVRTICEEPPRRPSAVNRTLRGDLETIALKALEKEPSRRYQSAEALGEDIRRYLSGEPILARRPSRLYVLRKKLSKHRLGIALAGAAMVLGAVGLVGGTWWSNRSLERQRARELAEQSRAREQQQVRDLDNARVRALIAQRLLEMGRVQDAYADAKALSSWDQTLPEARLVWAQTRFKVARQAGNEGTNMRDRVISDLKSALTSDPSRWEVHALLGEIYGAIGNPEADQLKEQANRDMPDTAEAWYLRSFTTLDLDEAVRCTEEAVQRGPAYTLAWERLAYLCLQTKRYDRALTAASELIDRGGDRLGWMIFQGRVLTEAGRYREAVERYTQAVDLFPGRQETYRGRGAAFLCERDYVRAIEDFGKMLEIEGPDDIWARYFRATPLWIAGRTTEAAEDYRRVRELRGQVSYQDGRRFLVLRDRAGRLQEQGRLADAERVRKEADAVLDADCLGVALGDPVERILKCLAGKLSPEALVASADRENLEEVCETGYYAGEACLLNGRDDEARKFFQMCVETHLVLDPNSRYPDPMNEYHLAVWRLEQLSAHDGATSQPEGG